MYNNGGPQFGMPQFHYQPRTSSQPNPQLWGPQFHSQLPSSSKPNVFKTAFSSGGSELIRRGLDAYVEIISESVSEFGQSIVCKMLTFFNFYYYFQVNDHYVKKKLKVILFPFLHRGQWTRITEPIGGFKPPIHDINAPDLYIPLMAFGTYLVLAGISLGLRGKFSPGAIHWLCIKGLIGWSMQTILLLLTLVTGSEKVPPILDIIAYAGYTFPATCLDVLGRIIAANSNYILIPWTCLCMGIFLVKTMQGILFAEDRSYDSSKHRYRMLFIALVQTPLLTWLGNITVNWFI